MGKVRHVVMGDEKAEEEARKKAEARRQTKQAKKQKETPDADGTDLKPEFKMPGDAAESGLSAQTGEDADKKRAGKKKHVKAKTRSKRYQEKAAKVDKTKLYTLSDAIALVKETSMTKFDGTVELHVNLNPATLGDSPRGGAGKDEKKDFRTQVSLPHGTGKKVNVVIADDAVIAEVTEGKINFDILVAHPSMMPKLAKVARILGPRGLMPNPKTGTVTPDPEKRVKELSSGQVNIRTEPDNPIIHMPVGKVSFAAGDLEANIQAVLSALGNKVSKATLTATMGPGVRIATQ